MGPQRVVFVFMSGCLAAGFASAAGRSAVSDSVTVGGKKFFTNGRPVPKAPDTAFPIKEILA